MVSGNLPLDMESSLEPSHTRLNKDQLKSVLPPVVSRVLFAEFSVVV